jgi:hypothetical protein
MRAIHVAIGPDHLLLRVPRADEPHDRDVGLPDGMHAIPEFRLHIRMRGRLRRLRRGREPVVDQRIPGPIPLAQRVDPLDHRAALGRVDVVDNAHVTRLERLHRPAGASRHAPGAVSDPVRTGDHHVRPRHRHDREQYTHAPGIALPRPP